MTLLRRKPATIQDVAQAAGVTKATVSYTFSGKRQVTSETRASVLRAAETLGYAPNPLAQRLSSTNYGNTIGLFSGHLEWSAGIRKFQIIQNLLVQRGFDVPVYISSPNDGEAIDTSVALLSHLRRQRPRAIIYADTQVAPKARIELEQFQEEGGVLITYDYLLNLDCDRVVFDREHNTYKAARHLLELGHRRIGFYSNSTQPGGVRLEGFQRALAEFDVPLHEEWLFNGSHEDGGAATAEAFLRLKERPTGLCMVNDYAATAFIGTAQRSGIRVPEEVSVVSHANLPIARHGATPLTTMTHPVEIIAQQVVELLASRLEGSYTGLYREIIVRGELVRRQSAQPPS